MRDYTPDDKASKIFVLIANGSTQDQMVKELGISKSAVSQRTDILQKHGYFVKKRVGIINELVLTSLGTAAIAKIARWGYNCFTYKPSMFRLHGIIAKCELLNPLDKYEPLQILDREKIRYKPDGLKNQASGVFTYNKSKAILRPRSLLLYPSEIYADDTENLYAVDNEGMNDWVKEFIDLENKLGLKFKRIDKDTLRIKILQKHIALTNNPIAKFSNNGGSRLEILDPTDGNKRIITDRSLGGDELEAVHPAYAVEDAISLYKMTEEFLVKPFNREEIIKRMKEIVNPSGSLCEPLAEVPSTSLE